MCAIAPVICNADAALEWPDNLSVASGPLVQRKLTWTSQQAHEVQRHTVYECAPDWGISAPTNGRPLLPWLQCMDMALLLRSGAPVPRSLAKGPLWAIQPCTQHMLCALAKWLTVCGPIHMEWPTFQPTWYIAGVLAFVCLFYNV